MVSKSQKKWNKKLQELLHDPAVQVELFTLKKKSAFPHRVLTRIEDVGYTKEHWLP